MDWLISDAGQMDLKAYLVFIRQSMKKQKFSYHLKSHKYAIARK
jgi:hypothetical protein